MTIRIGEEDWANVQAFCQTYGLDISGAVRQALRAARAPQNGLQAAQEPPRRFIMPDRILRMSRPYLAYGNGSLKDEWFRRLDEFFAMTFATKQLYPKTQVVAQCLAHFIDLEQRFPRDIASV